MNEIILPDETARNADAFARDISGTWQKSIAAILETGRLLKAAKSQLPHGEFQQMIENQLPFGVRESQRLMAIAADERLSNATHGSCLPPSPRTLYELTKLDYETFAARLEDKTIRPEMMRKDITTVAKKAKRVARERELGDKQIALPTRKFGVVYADPEWKFETYSAETGMDRAADNHYATSSVEMIKARPVGDIAADDCVLFLWATVPMLEHALDVLNEWGFKYRSQFIWRKPKAGTGYWNRNRHDILLIGTRGKVPCPAQGEQWGSVITADLARHSQKPDNFYYLIEHYFPSLPKIELNARGVARDGWCAWGNETESDEARGITLVDGVSDASHLPLLPNPGKPCVGKENGGGAGDGPTRANGGATKKSSPPVGTKARAKASKKSEDMSAPIVARVNIDDLELLVRVADKKISFYAMQKHPLFPSELGCVSADCFEIVTAANISAVSNRIWSSEFVANASASMRASTWRIPTTIYKSGRTGPIPVMGDGTAEGGAK